MTSPFPPSTAAPGDGRIVATRSPTGAPALESVAYQYPLKLIAPTTGAGMGDHDGTADGGKKSSLVFLLSYGGGLVAGDQVNLVVDVRAGARLTLLTQGTTKVFKASGDGRVARVAEPTRQNLDMAVAPGGALCLLPDPVQPFADSCYEQRQAVTLHDDATAGAAALVLLDWVTQGRAARGENWDFASWKGRNEVWLQTETGSGGGVHKRLLVRDAVMLAPGYLDGGGQDRPSDASDVSSSLDASASASSSGRLRSSMQGLSVFGTLILRGPRVDATGRFFMDEFAALPRLGERGFSEVDRGGSNTDDAWRARRVADEDRCGLLWSAAAVRGCVVVKFGARSVEGARLWLGAMLMREGSVGALFGDEALICVR